jgi:hypothetical protein
VETNSTPAGPYSLYFQWFLDISPRAGDLP